MTHEKISPEKKAAFEKRLGCVFREDGDCAEMSLPLSDYTEQTRPIDGVSFGFYGGDIAKLREAVAVVEKEWVQYFDGEAPIFCGFKNGKAVSFCLIDTDEDCLISESGVRVGSIGCVGTIPSERRQGIGLRMVDLATAYLKNSGCDKSYIHYTRVDNWYAKLGYKVFARFSFLEKE